MGEEALSAAIVLIFPPFFPWRERVCMCVCGFVCMSKSALHWPDPGCCTKSPVSPAQPRKVVDAQPGRLPFPCRRTPCNAQTLQSRAHCSTACISRAPPARAELKSLRWGTAAKSDTAIWRCPSGRSWWDGVNQHAGLFRQGVKAVVGRVRGCPDPSLLTHVPCCQHPQGGRRACLGHTNTCRKQAGT